MGVKSTDRSPKGFGTSKIIDGYLTQFFKTERTGNASGLSATGGSVFTPGDGYTYHIFTGSGTFTVSSAPQNGALVDVLLVGGGGGGGAGNRGAGAGAGGLVYRPGLPVNIDFYNVFIGSGGSSGTYNGPAAGFDRKGSPGSNTTFGASQAGPWPATSLVALGGGRGGGGDGLNNGGTGGSGGSSWYPTYPAVAGTQTTEPTIPADSRTYGFGNPSGSSLNAPVYGGGGGGAGAAGRPANDGTYAGGGGAGKQYPQFGNSNIPGLPFSPYDGKFAGGGTSADYPAGSLGNQTRSNPESVPFGGGAGNNNLTTPGSNPVLNGAFNTGGGGGSGGSGGSGVAIVRYSTNKIESQRIFQFHHTGTDQVFTVPTAATYTSATIYAWGAGGGGGYTGGSGSGGGGGFSQATIPVSPSATFTVVVGGGGDTRGPSAGQGSATYGGAGLTGPQGFGGHGGGLSGVFYGSSAITFDSSTQPRSIVIAGAGGGASWEGAVGGAGGGTTGQNGGAGSQPGGSGGTQSAGGAGGQGSNGNGGALFGGTEPGTNGGGSGGGGAGYYGGGAGSNNDPGSAGGGGSGYVGGHPLYPVSDTTTTQGSGSSVANSSSPYYNPGTGNGGASGANVGEPGFVVIILNK